MRLRNRALLLSIVPFGLLLASSFLMAQRLVQSAVKNVLRSSARQSQTAIGRIRAKSGLQNNRFLRIAGENSSMKAGVQLLLSLPKSVEARQTLEDQLSDMCDRMGFDLLIVSTPEGAPLAGVIRQAGRISPLPVLTPAAAATGLRSIEGIFYQTASVPVDQGDENIAMLQVGERFELSDLYGPAVLAQGRHVMLSSVSGATGGELEHALSACGGKPECDVLAGSAHFLASEVTDTGFGKGYRLLTLQDTDATVRPVQDALHNAFLTVSAGALAVAILFSFISSRSIAGPISAMASHLQTADATGLLPEFRGSRSSIKEIGDLTRSFNRAAASIQEGRESLQRAYVEFVGSLASALDARDRYTAGHSERVSRLSAATAAAMNLDQERIEKIKVGALLHDIGKIGVPDQLLQKPGKLTPAEFSLVMEHPVIGRRILEGVQGFTPYLAAVELHHENWDGSGYPHGQKGTETPIDARIIHVADVYDAMTTDRPYRRGMAHCEAMRFLRSMAGIQFDPRIVEVFMALPHWTENAAEEFAFAGYAGDL